MALALGVGGVILLAHNLRPGSIIGWKRVIGEEAITLVKRHKRASTSFLQRRLRIGYPRAARIMDTLEEQGIVGPPVRRALTRGVYKRFRGRRRFKRAKYRLRG